MGKKDGMYLYNDWLAPFEKLEKAEVGELIIAMMKYSISGEKPPEYQGLLAMAADFIFPQIDRSKEYARLGSRGGIATSRKASIPKETDREKGKEDTVEIISQNTDTNEELREAESVQGEQAQSDECVISEEYIKEKSAIPPKKEDKKEDPPSQIEKEAFADSGLYEKQLFDDRFMKFWRNYPRKVERQRAYTVFQKIHPDDALVKKMIEAIDAQKKNTRWKKDDGQFIPYPANWLEGRRWEDEVESSEGGALTEEEQHEKGDKKEESASSFDTDDFFKAALRRADDYTRKILSDDLSD